MNRQSVPALLDHRRDYVVGRQHVSARLVEVQRLRSQYAALIIGDGLFSSGWSEADDVLTDLAEARTEQQCAALDRLLAGVEPGPHDPSALVTEIMALAAETGYLLGLAVGTQLGPSALEQQPARP